jgi:hypothetical protein
MSILNLEFNAGTGGRPPRNKRAVKVWLGVGLVAAVLGVGSTLASTITINANNQTEFGQGVTSSVYCGGTSNTVNLTPISYFNAQDNKFYLGQIKVDGIPDSCAGVDFTLTAYPTYDPQNPNSKNAVPIAGISATDSPITTLNVWFTNNCPVQANPAAKCDPATQPTATAQKSLIWYESSPGSAALMDPLTNPDIDVAVATTLGQSGTSSFILNFPTTNPWVTSDSVGKILIETKNDVNGYGFWNPSGVDPATPVAPLT